jgi:hypothetical protein
LARIALTCRESAEPESACAATAIGMSTTPVIAPTTRPRNARIMGTSPNQSQGVALDRGPDARTRFRDISTVRVKLFSKKKQGMELRTGHE